MKTSELTGAALDWAVAKVEGYAWKPVNRPYRCFDCAHYEERQGRDEAIQYCHHPKMDFNDGSAGDSWASDFECHKECPYKTEVQTPTYPACSTDWAHGGPIIEREQIEVRVHEGSRVKCEWKSGYWDEDKGVCVWLVGPTPLIAAMRCLVASHLGDEVEIPEELT